MKRYLEFYYSSDPYRDAFKLYICLDVMEKITEENMLSITHTRDKPLHNIIAAFFYGNSMYVNEVKIPDEYLIDPSLTHFKTNNLNESPIYVTQNNENSDYLLSWKAIYDSGIIDTSAILLYHSKVTFDIQEKVSEENYKWISDRANKILEYYKFDSYSTYLFMQMLLYMGLETIAYKAYKMNSNLTNKQIHYLLAIMNTRIIKYPKQKNKKIISNELYDVLTNRVDTKSRWDIRNRALKYDNINLHHEQIFKSLSKHDLKRLQNISPSLLSNWSVGNTILRLATDIPLNKTATESDIKFINKLLDNNMYECTYSKLSI